MKFGKLRLSVKGTNNGRGFDILYDFGKSLNFIEFESKPEFYFIQPWMQFPSNEYSDTCKLVSIELVRRFNEFEDLEARVKKNDAEQDDLYKMLRKEQAALLAACRVANISVNGAYEISELNT